MFANTNDLTANYIKYIKHIEQLVVLKINWFFYILRNIKFICSDLKKTIVENFIKFLLFKNQIRIQ